MKLDEVVPWGRSLAEYEQMFNLTPADLHRHILGCGDGPAGFNAELTAQGGRVISLDPIYQFSAAELEQKIDAVYPHILEQLQQNSHNYIWETHQTVEEVGRVRLEAMRQFLADYEGGIDEGRYLVGALPELPFTNHQFSLALCSHFLFLYSDQFDLAFHLASLDELCRVAKEVRVYPLVNLRAETSPHLGEALKHLMAEGWRTELQPVPYRFQKGATEMLVIYTTP